jgi:hypothetical protein
VEQLQKQLNEQVSCPCPCGAPAAPPCPVHLLPTTASLTPSTLKPRCPQSPPALAAPAPRCACLPACLQSGANSLLRQRIASLDRERTDLAVRLQQQGRQPPSAAQQASIAELTKQLNGLQQQLLFAQQEVGCRRWQWSWGWGWHPCCCPLCSRLRCEPRLAAWLTAVPLLPPAQLETAQRSSRERDQRLREAESQLAKLQAELKKVRPGAWGAAGVAPWACCRVACNAAGAGAAPDPKRPVAPLSWPLLKHHCWAARHSLRSPLAPLTIDCAPICCHCPMPTPAEGGGGNAA